MLKVFKVFKALKVLQDLDLKALKEFKVLWAQLLECRVNSSLIMQVPPQELLD